MLPVVERAQRAERLAQGDAGPALQLTQPRAVLDRVRVGRPRGENGPLLRGRQSRVREHVVWMIESGRRRDEPVERQRGLGSRLIAYRRLNLPA